MGLLHPTYDKKNGEQGNIGTVPAHLLGFIFFGGVGAPTFGFSMRTDTLNFYIIRKYIYVILVYNLGVLQKKNDFPSNLRDQHL